MVSDIRAALYARISHDSTGEALGVARQVEDCRKLAADRGWTVAEVYEDNDISAYSGKHRPAYERMLEDIAGGRIDAVVVYNSDRLTRQPIELEQFALACKAAGVTRLVTVTGDLNLGNDDGMFTARVLGAVAAKESARKSERLKRKALEIAAAGRPNGTYRRPFGYEQDQLTVIASEAEVIRQLTARYLAGESLTSLVDWLNAAGVATVAGAEWRTGSVRQILTNPRIAGLRAHHGEVVAKAVWPAIITPAQHDQLLAAFERKKHSGHRRARRYLLSGMLRCGKCGQTLYSSARGDTRRYVCMSAGHPGACGRLTVVAAPVEEWIEEAVLYRLDTPEMADVLAGRAAADERYAALLADLQSDQALIEEARQLYVTKQIPATEWLEVRKPIQARADATLRQLDQLTGHNALAGLVGNGSQLREQWRTLNLDRQVAIVKAVLDSATILPRGGEGVRQVDPNRIVPVWAR